MKMNHKTRPPSCQLCGSCTGALTECDGGHICETCVETARIGRDTTKRSLRTKQRALRGQALITRIEHAGGAVDNDTEYAVASAVMMAEDQPSVGTGRMRTAGGEVVPEGHAEFRDTLAVPDAIAMDASAHRLELVSTLGNEVAAMALDTAETVGAANTLERMFSHQLAALHNAAMTMFSKASLASDPVASARTMNLAIRAAEVFQRGAINFKRLRGGGQQVMRIEHVNIAPGGQAVIGQIKTGGAKK